MAILSLAALVIFLNPIDALANRAVVRVQVRPSAPRIQVRTNISHRHENRVQPRRVKKYYKRHTLTVQDRWIATTLSYETGVPKRWLLDDRTRGYSWVKIGRRWDMSRRMVRFALAESQRVHSQPRNVRCLTSR